MSGFKVEENENIYGTKIKAIGVGGGGGNMINRIISEYSQLDIDLIVSNTDAQALKNSKAHTKIQLGEKKTKGLGAGMKPEIGKEAATESYEELKSVLENTDLVFVAAGLGGGTGTGAAPIVAQAAKENGALVVSVVTLPFEFEGKKRLKLANLGLEELKKECDSIIVIQNEKLSQIMDKSASVNESFRVVDNILASAVGGLSTVILGEGYMNIDFADVRTVMSHRGMAIMGVGESSGENAAQEALQEAIQSPLLGDININGAMGILVNFTHHPDTPMREIREAMSVIREAANDDADIIFGTIPNENLENNKIQVIVIATGFHFEEEKNLEEKVENNSAFSKEKIAMFKKVSGDDIRSIDDLDIPAYKRYMLD